MTLDSPASAPGAEEVSAAAITGTLPESVAGADMKALDSLLARALRFHNDNAKLYTLRETEENRAMKPRYFTMNDEIRSEVAKATPEQIDNVFASVVTSKVHYEVLRSAVAALAGRERRETMDGHIERLGDSTLRTLLQVHRGLLDDDTKQSELAPHIQSRNINYYKMWAQMGSELGIQRLESIASGRNTRYDKTTENAQKALQELSEQGLPL
jgi:ribonuclease D